MKKIYFITIIIGMAYLSLFCYFSERVNPSKYHDVYIRYQGEKIIVFETDHIIKELLKGTAIKDSPSCPFGDVVIIFTKDDEEISIYPAGDSCNTMLYVKNGENYYYHIGEKVKALKEILERYGVKYPHSI